MTWEFAMINLEVREF